MAKLLRNKSAAVLQLQPFLIWRNDDPQNRQDISTPLEDPGNALQVPRPPKHDRETTPKAPVDIFPLLYRWSYVPERRTQEDVLGQLQLTSKSRHPGHVDCLQVMLRMWADALDRSHSFRPWVPHVHLQHSDVYISITYAKMMWAMVIQTEGTTRSDASYSVRASIR